MYTAIKQEILNALLDKYENSSLFLKGASSRRIMINVFSTSAFSDLMEDADRKAGFIASLEELKDEGLIDFSWARYEKGNLVEKFWLITKEQALIRSYDAAERPQKSSILERLYSMIEESLDNITDKASIRESKLIRERKTIGESVSIEEDISTPKGITTDEDISEGRISFCEDAYDPVSEEITDFLKEMQLYLREKKKIPVYFFRQTEDPDAEIKNRNLLRFFTFIARNKDEQMVRVISQRLYGDSKYFERVLKSKVCAALKYTVSKTDGSGEVSGLLPDDILSAYGIVRWPQIMEFCGNLRIVLDDGSICGFSKQKYGAYINTETYKLKYIINYILSSSSSSTASSFK